MVRIILEDGEEAVERRVSVDGRISGLGRFPGRKVMVVILKVEEEEKG
jgi:hypothetical protein